MPTKKTAKKTKNVLIISASFRPNSNSHALCQEVVKGMRAAFDLGPLAEIKDYVLELGPNVKIPGKVFGGAAVKAGGADFSLQVFAPGTAKVLRKSSIT